MTAEIEGTDDLVTLTVAKGRSVTISNGRHYRCSDEEKRDEAPVPIKRDYAAGEEVTLARHEAQRLFDIGFLVDPASTCSPNSETEKKRWQKSAGACAIQ